jgi:hypothetical protein
MNEDKTLKLLSKLLPKPPMDDMRDEEFTFTPEEVGGMNLFMRKAAGDLDRVFKKF